MHAHSYSANKETRVKQQFSLTESSFKGRTENGIAKVLWDLTQHSSQAGGYIEWEFGPESFEIAAGWGLDGQGLNA